MGPDLQILWPLGSAEAVALSRDIAAPLAERPLHKALILPVRCRALVVAQIAHADLANARSGFDGEGFAHLN
jgi:hypothetical protein